MVHPLSCLIDDVDLTGTYWNKKYGLFKQATSVAGLMDEAEIQATLDAGLLRWPYFTLLKDGYQPPRVDFTAARVVNGQRVNWFADAPKVRSLLADGATMKISQIEDWHIPTRSLMTEIERIIPAELKAYMFYTPRDNTGMLPHRDGSHVLAIQIAGAKEWRIYDSPDQIDARGGLDVDVDTHCQSFVMESGDVLYLPHGIPHVATARGGTSLHLTFTITEPTPLSLAESVAATFAACAEQIEREFQASLDGKADEVRKALSKHVGSVSAADLLETAVHLMRTRIA